MVSSGATAAEISAGMSQIITFWKVLPEEWKGKSRSIFKKLWDEKKVIISDDSDSVRDSFDVDFEDERIYRLASAVNSYNRACLIAGRQILNYWQKGLTEPGKEVRKSIEETYGEEGLKVLNMMTTRDVEYVVEDMEDIENMSDDDIQQRFNEWISDYNKFSKRVTVPEIRDDGSQVKEDIIELSKETPKDFIVLHISASTEDIMKLNGLITDLKENERLSYSELDMDQFERGFQDVGRIEILFN